MQSKKPVIISLIIILVIVFIFILVRRADDVSVIESNRTDIVEHIQSIAVFTFEYYTTEINGEIRGTFEGLELPEDYAETEFGTFELIEKTDYEATIQGVSAHQYGTVEATVDSTGELHSWSYTGHFDTIPGRYGLKP